VQGSVGLWVRDSATLETTITAAKFSAKNWQSKPISERAELILQVADALEANRGRLIQVMMAEAGKTLDQADPEVSEAVDFARYYARQASQLEQLDGAKHISDDLVLVTPPWNFPIAIPAGSVLAALAAGSAVVMKPAPQVSRCGYLLAEIFNSVLPAGVFNAIQVAEDGLGRSLITHPAIDQVVLTGAFSTAALFREFKPELRLIGETSGKNAIIVTEHADLDLAAKDVVASAFGHAGQKCSAASLVILVGSVSRSKRFENQLLDAARSLVVDYATNPLAQMGPLIEAPANKLVHGLTELDSAEEWLLQPRQLDDTARLWTPGIRKNVVQNSASFLTEYFGPVLSIMHARTLDEAIALQNASDYGLTAGLHSLSATETERWLSQVQAGNLYINRGITGAIVQRQPFGGWKASAVGATAKAGGPNYLYCFGRFESSPIKNVSDAQPNSLVQKLLDALKDLVDPQTFKALERSTHSDAEAIANVFSKVTDVTGLNAERNLFRYAPADCLVRIENELNGFERYRPILAAIATGAKLSIDRLRSGEEVLASILAKQLTIESQQQLLARNDFPRIWASTIDPALLGVGVGHYRNQAVESGRITLLCFYKEQAIAITNHRFGNPLKVEINVESLV
jgi:RHH-type proline utilization regulon transcriptional repressor/proline dehydrogenase/delta 1-pyrroline-5-carboxylate dehydrogenase